MRSDKKFEFGNQEEKRIRERPEQFDRFCGDEYAPLLAMLTLHCGDRVLAEEFAQEAFVRAGIHWNRVHKMDYPSRWLWKVGFNVANSFFRRRAAERRARKRLESNAPETSGHEDPSDRVGIVQMLSTVTARQRTVLILHYFNDLTFAEVAEVLDMPEATAKSLAQRGLARVRADLRDEMEREAAHDVC